MLRQVRILRVVWNMGSEGVGGIETTAMHQLRRMDAARYLTDFLYVEHEPQGQCYYDEEIQARGSQIFHLSKKRRWSFGSEFRRLLDDHGPYDVVHSHLRLFNGAVLRLAHQAGVPVRVAHSHNDASSETWIRAGIPAWFNRVLIRRHATHALAVSRAAADSYYGQGWQNDPRFEVLLQGRDLSPFAAAVERTRVRQELKLPPDAFVIGNVARFLVEKNHEFLLAIAAEAVKRDPKMRLLLVGDGPLRPVIEQQARQLGIADWVVFAGTRSDVPRLMLGAMDAFVLPTVPGYEGLALVLLEAQAAGLPCVFPDHLSPEIDVVDGLVHRLSLARPAAEWAAALLNAPKDLGDRRASLAVVQRSQFNIDAQVKRLEEIYTSGLSTAHGVRES